MDFKSYSRKALFSFVIFILAFGFRYYPIRRHVTYHYRMTGEYESQVFMNAGFNVHFSAHGTHQYFPPREGILSSLRWVFPIDIQTVESPYSLRMSVSPRNNKAIESFRVHSAKVVYGRKEISLLLTRGGEVFEMGDLFKYDRHPDPYTSLSHTYFLYLLPHDRADFANSNNRIFDFYGMGKEFEVHADISCVIDGKEYRDTVVHVLRRKKSS